MIAQILVETLLEAYEDNWTPSPSDIAWTQQLLNAMNNGGLWGTSEGVFKVNKTDKILLYAGMKGQIFHRVGKCAEHLGYTVRHVSDNPDEQSFAM